MIRGMATNIEKDIDLSSSHISHSKSLSRESQVLPNPENTFKRHIDKVIQSYVDNYDSSKLISREMFLESLGNCLFDYKLPEDDVDQEIKFRKSLADFDFCQHLINNIPKALTFQVDTDESSIVPSLDQFQLDVLSIIHEYRDLLYTERNYLKGGKLRLCYCIHALNHILNTRSRVVSHNAKLKKSTKANADYRDQGLTRPKVLIVLPFRESAYRTIECMIDLIIGDHDQEDSERMNIMNIKRFNEEFQSDETLAKPSKPQDYNDLFTGNIDENFRIGLSVTKKSLKLYTDFYSSDIIVASPLGLRMIIGAEGDKERDYDFLSSIEILILDQADVFLMQSWEHVLDIMNHLHLQPTDSHGLDFSRARMWALDGLYRFYRQTLIFSSVDNLQLRSLFKRKCFNYEGRIIVQNPVSQQSSQLGHILVQSPQTFYQFETKSLLDSVDDRFNFFVTKILPRCDDIGQAHTMIFIPSYFDFVRLRNYFRDEDINFTQICEYSKKGKIAQSRAWFFHEGRNFLLYTERCHFYKRLNIKGIRHLVFYQLPTYPHFYSELCNLVHPSNQGKKFKGDQASMNITVIYCKFDLVQLESVVGSEKSFYMVNPENDEHLFVSQPSSDKIS